MQTSLFQIEGNELIRSEYRKLSTNTEHLKKADLSIIKIRPDNFNARIKPTGMIEEAWNIILMIPQLADGIFANNGPARPILGDFHTDGNFYITDGERTFRALIHLINTDRTIYPNGEPVNITYILLNAPGTTDLDRKKRMYNTNDTLPLSPLQKANYFLSFTQEPYNMTHEQIAGAFPKLSRQTVDNYILITEMPADLQQKIENDEIKLTNALAEYRSSKKKKKIVEVDEETGEVFKTLNQEEREKEEALKKSKERGDEDEFEQQDNSIAGTSSKGGFKEEGSGAIVIGKDAIYMDAQKLALWKQMINRFHVIECKILEEATLENGYLLRMDDLLAERLKNEYNLTVK